MDWIRGSRGSDKDIPMPIEHLVLSDKWVRIPSANYFPGHSPVHYTGLRLSLTLSQNSRIPGAKQVISLLRVSYLVITS